MDRPAGAPANRPTARAGGRQSRRNFLLSAAGVTLSLAGIALPAGCARPAADVAPPANFPRIAYLSLSSPVGGSSPSAAALLQGLRERGYVGGQNLSVEYRFARGRRELLPALAGELIRLGVDVIFAPTSAAAHAAATATGTTPIVALSATSDPAAARLVADLARTAGNVTAVVASLDDLSGERLRLLKEAAPTISRVGLLWNPTYRAATQVYQESRYVETRAVAESLGVRVLSLEVRNAGAFSPAFQAAMGAQADALVVWGDPLTLAHQARILDFAAQSRLPAMYDMREFAEGGGLMALGPSFRALYRRAAAHLDSVLRGAKPADLPVEQPPWPGLVIDLKTAEALALKVPPPILAQATQVIQ